MEVWIGGEIESVISDKFRLARIEVERQLTQYLSEKQYDIELDSLDCIAIIRDDSEFCEIHNYSTKKRDMDFRLIIDFEQFNQANHEECQNLILSMLLRAVDILGEKIPIQALKADLNEFSKAVKAI
tara:strand:- start:1443 stop:1823 length:381 start_codon:yes stop_codon:yes gene_type:complete